MNTLAMVGLLPLVFLVLVLVLGTARNPNFWTTPDQRGDALMRQGKFSEAAKAYGIYSKPPEVLDKSNRGRLSGNRRDTITYVCQRAGQFTIPAVRLTWFDLDAQKLRTIDFPARHLSVSSNPALESTAAPQGQSVSWTALSWLSAAALAALIATLCYQYWMPWVSRALVRWRALHLQPLNPIDPRLSIVPRPAHTSRGRSPPKGRKESADSSSHQKL